MKNASIGTDRNPYKLFSNRDFRLRNSIYCPREVFKGKIDKPIDACRYCNNGECSIYWLKRYIKREY